MGENPSKGGNLRLTAIVWLTVVSSVAFGMMAATKNYWPYPQIVAASQFINGHPEDRTTLSEKILNDWGAVPFRHIVSSAPLAHSKSAYRALDALPLKATRDPPILYLGQDAPRGYRIIVGTFDFQESLHGVILFDPEGRVQKIWQITQNDLKWPHRPDHLIFPHGFEVTRDGSIIVAYDAGSSLTKYDYCGRKQWQVEGGFHHSIDLLDEETLWVWGNTESATLFGLELMQVSVRDGAILRRFKIPDIMDANPDIDIFGIRQIDEPSGFIWTDQPFHPNDIDPLPEKLANHYPDFTAGDLLVSLRSLNLIFVVDPLSLKVKWWRIGLTRRQHDPDWNARGTITIYNNNMHREYSSIIEVDPQSLESRTLIDGKDYDFYAWHRGKHDQLPNGNILITSPTQGRVFEVTPDGSVTFDFHNMFSEESGQLAVSEARFLSKDYFYELPKCTD